MNRHRLYSIMGAWYGTIETFNESNKDRDKQSDKIKKEIDDFIYCFNGDWNKYYIFIKNFKGFEIYAEKKLKDRGF